MVTVCYRYENQHEYETLSADIQFDLFNSYMYSIYQSKYMRIHAKHYKNFKIKWYSAIYKIQMHTYLKFSLKPNKWK